MVHLYSIEGNIGSGKSTLIKYLKEHLKNAHKITEHEYESLFDNDPDTKVIYYGVLTTGCGSICGTSSLKLNYFKKQRFSTSFLLT